MTATELAVLRAMLVRHEGLRLTPYRDTKGAITIGIGHNLTAKGIPASQANAWFEEDLAEAMQACLVYDWFKKLEIGRQMAVIDLMFNIGPRSFAEFHKMIAALAVQNYSEAAKQLNQSDWAKEVQPARVKDLTALLLTGILPQ